MGQPDVPQEAIAEAADLLAEKIDMLLERATDAVLRGPQPGSEQWRREWTVRDTDAGRAAAPRTNRDDADTAADRADPHNRQVSNSQSDDAVTRHSESSPWVYAPHPQ